MRNKQKTIVWIATYFLLCYLSACVKNNPDPSWLEITEFKLEKNPLLSGNEGAIHLHAFKHAWVYIDEKYIGVFELPCKVPVLYQGRHVVRVFPTINNNGVALEKKIYPFVDSYVDTIDFIANKTTIIQPTTRYLSATTFWIEDFQGSTIKVHDGLDTKTSLLTENENANTFGRIVLTPEHPRWSGYVSLDYSDGKPFIFPLGTEIYLEFECKNTHPIKTFCSWQTQTGETGTQIHYGSAKSDEWKKMYIDYTQLVAYSGGMGFWFGFISDLPAGDSQAILLIDNIKVVYR